MTDNRTTELLKDYVFTLRRLEYDVDKPGSNMTLGEYEAEEKRVTDEYAQAIAATLGNGTLTAEQVREAIKANSLAETSSLFEFNDSSWQAIADELNAELWSGTCKLEQLSAIDVALNMLDCVGWCECSNCGHATPDESNYCQHCGKRIRKAAER